jgi:hypothetical protein
MDRPVDPAQDPPVESAEKSGQSFLNCVRNYLKTEKE